MIGASSRSGMLTMRIISGANRVPTMKVMMPASISDQPKE